MCNQLENNQLTQCKVMKKLCIKNKEPGSIYSNKLLLTMKLTTVLLVFGFLQVSAAGLSQGNKVDLNMDRVSFEEFVAAVEQQTNYRFVYLNKTIEDIQITAKGKNTSTPKLIASSLTEAGLNYEITESKLVIITPENATSRLQPRTITGTVTNENGEPLPGLSISIKGTTIGTVTDMDGEYTFEIDDPSTAVLVFSFIGMQTQEIAIGDQTEINISMMADLIGLDEVVVVGYGTQKRSDITGTIGSIPNERLEMVPNLNVAQALQGSVSGVNVRQNTAGANPNSTITIRGNNSIAASNEPLVIIDGIPGSHNNINPNDIESIEILKDASASAIYGSRGSNGVILITTKQGKIGKPKISYKGYVSTQKLVHYPDVMDGGEFYNFKVIRDPSAMTIWEQERFDSGDWTYWPDEALRNGLSHQHDLSVSGATDKVNYYISGGFLDVQGLQVNDDYKRVTTRVNLKANITDWLSIGTRTHFRYSDQSGVPVDMTDAFYRNPLGEVYDSDGNLTIRPVPHYTDSNPLGVTLYDNINKGYYVSTNNYIDIDFPFISGLKYRLNTGVNIDFADQKTYRPRTTAAGEAANGSSSTRASQGNNTTIENILSYNNTFGKHGISGTLLYSMQSGKSEATSLSASLYPNDLNKWNSIGQAEVVNPSYQISERTILSQMIRLNYSYDTRYLLTLTARRDGYSGFGVNSKWGTFPSAAIGWNIHKEDFFPSGNFISNLKLRVSYGLNGNQAIDPYQTIARMRAENNVSLSNPIPGYYPSTLAQDNLSWESSKTLNAGIDFGFLDNRIHGDLNIYQTITTDLLLERTISPIHGISDITDNIGETQNNGLELYLNATAIQKIENDFYWNIAGNLSLLKNRINSLYGILDEEGNEIDDIGSKWFIGQPIAVNYDWKMIGIWQLDEAVEAATYGQQPGFVKVEDINTDGKIDAEDRQLIGQRSPKILWGMTNSLSYKDFTLIIFLHGVHGATKSNPLWRDHALAEVRLNTTNKDWWTPENPDATWVINDPDGEFQGGKRIAVYESTDFVRIKDISLSYDLSNNLTKNWGLDQFRIYIAARNLFTFTKWEGLDPELSGQRDTPLQKEFVIGLNIGF